MVLRFRSYVNFKNLTKLVKEITESKLMSKKQNKKQTQKESLDIHSTFQGGSHVWTRTEINQWTRYEITGLNNSSSSLMDRIFYRKGEK